jgi:hypothetical protein
MSLRITYGRNGNITVPPIGLLHFFVNEIEVDQFLDLPKGVVLPDSRF